MTDDRILALENKQHELDKSYAVLNAKVDNLLDGISEIKNNHLIHINDKLEGFVKDSNIFHKEIIEKITTLSLTDAKNEPTQAILSDVIKYVIIAIVGAVVGVVVSHSI